MKNRNLFILAAVILLVVAVVIFVIKQKGTNVEPTVKQVVLQGEAIDIALDYYNNWLDAAQSTTTNPYDQGLDKLDWLGTEVKDYLVKTKTDESNLDPVLCQTVVPEKIGAKPVFETPTKAQYMIIARGTAADKSQQSIVTLESLDGGWYISNIACGNGETAPAREFTFEKEGYLLKSVPPPLDSNYWHLVYKVDGVDGYTAQLFFSETSVCVLTDGTESPCNTNNFDEPSKVMIKGQMTEAGAEVSRVEFIKD